MALHLPLTFWRRVTQLSFLGIFIALPLFGIIRIDVPHFRLYIVGQQLWLNDFLFIYIIWGMMVPLLLMTYMFFGRAICGWVCPQTIISEIANRVNFFLTGKRVVGLKKNEHVSAREKASEAMLLDTSGFFRQLGRKMVGVVDGPKLYLEQFGLYKSFLTILAVIGTVLFSFFIAFILVSYFVPPQVIIERVINRELSMSAFMNTFNRDPHLFHGQRLLGQEGSTAFFWIILVGVLLSANILYLRHTWCKLLCPYGMWQCLWRNKNALRVTFDESRRSECTDCDRCRRSCFMEVEPRQNPEKQFDCINCGVCINQCSSIMNKKGSKGLLDFGFGWNASQTNPSKKKNRAPLLFYLLPLIFLFSAARMVYELSFYQPLAVSISKDGAYQMKNQKALSEYNHYIITVINKGKESATYTLSYEGIPRGAAHFDSPEIQVEGGEVKRISFVIDDIDPSQVNSGHTFRVTAAHRYIPRIQRTDEARYFVPAKT